MIENTFPSVPIRRHGGLRGSADCSDPVGAEPDRDRSVSSVIGDPFCEQPDAPRALRRPLFPTKLGEEVRIILPREDGTFYRACHYCEAELDLSLGEWVSDYPGRPIHGYRISQLFSSKVDPGEILREYRKTSNPERFFTLKIGIPWADVENKLSPHQVLALCGDSEMVEESAGACTMGVDTGKLLHVVVSRALKPKEDWPKREVLWIGTAQSYEELDSLMKRFRVSKCVIDALPEIHATRAFADRHRGQVWLNYFNESQRGSYKWDKDQHIVQVNRTEALDAAKKGIRDGHVILPRRGRLVEEFADHLASDAKKLIEDEATGAQTYRYLRTGTNHYSLAFTYDWIASERERKSSPWDTFIGPIGEETMSGRLIRSMRHEGLEWPIRWDREY
jgi:hypothetical protein